MGNKNPRTISVILLIAGISGPSQVSSWSAVAVTSFPAGWLNMERTGCAVAYHRPVGWQDRVRSKIHCGSVRVIARSGRRRFTGLCWHIAGCKWTGQQKRRMRRSSALSILANEKPDFSNTPFPGPAEVSRVTDDCAYRGVYL